MSDSPTPKAKGRRPTIRKLKRSRSWGSMRTDDTYEPPSPTPGGEGISVVARVRPMNESETAHGPKCVTVHEEENIIEINRKGKTHRFPYSRVIGPWASQEDVYNTSARPVVEAVLNGYSGAVIAYGQTGAGKTHTMQGPGFDDPELYSMGHVEGLKGIIPRALEHIFHELRRTSMSVNTMVEASYIEIYMEEVYDLLNPRWTEGREPKQIPLKVVGNADILLKGMRETRVSNASSAIAVMLEGARNRKLAATKANKESSRSHAVFLLTLHSRRPSSAANTRSQLYLVDLAGSEAVSKTGASGMRLKEAMKINQSLLALGNVIAVLSSKDKSKSKRKVHVPYRASKLTRILKNCLGGNTKTMLIINCSPSPFNASETLSTLRFGARTSKIQNRPTITKMRTLEIVEEELMLSQRKVEAQAKEIASLKEKIRKLSMGDHTAGSSDLELEVDDGDDDGDDGGMRHSSHPMESHVSPTSFSVSGEDEKRWLGNGCLRWNEIVGTHMFNMQCPLTSRVFTDPVFAADGYTYSREAIRVWVRRRGTSPITGMPMRSTDFIPNRNMKKQIANINRFGYQFDFLSALPYEAILKIMAKLDLPSLLRLGKVNRTFYQHSKDPYLWRSMLRTDFGGVYDDVPLMASRKYYFKKWSRRTHRYSFWLERGSQTLYSNE